MKVLVFLHGTVIMHHAAMGKPRVERVRQVKQGEPSTQDFASYVPVGGAVNKLRTWAGQGAEIYYASSRRESHELEDDRQVLARNGFPEGQLVHRGAGEDYGDLVARVRPDVLIEDNCQSIGGWPQSCIAQTRPEIAGGIISILVPEFGGVDHLPDDLDGLSGPRS
jgi:hypothetical protein